MVFFSTNFYNKPLQHNSFSSNQKIIIRKQINYYFLDVSLKLSHNFDIVKCMRKIINKIIIRIIAFNNVCRNFPFSLTKNYKFLELMFPLKNVNSEKYIN